MKKRFFRDLADLIVGAAFPGMASGETEKIPPFVIFIAVLLVLLILSVTATAVIALH